MGGGLESLRRYLERGKMGEVCTGLNGRGRMEGMKGGVRG